MLASVCVRHVRVNEKTYANNVDQEAQDKSNEEQLFNRRFGRSQLESKELSLVHKSWCNVWMADDNSLNDHQRSLSFSKCRDKILNIDVAVSRRMIWLTPEGALHDEIGPHQSVPVASTLIVSLNVLRSGRIDVCALV